MATRDWYRVGLSDRGIQFDVSPPGRAAWQAFIPWGDITRVCFRTEYLISDGWYIFIKQRPESYAVPADAEGGDALMNELLRRKLFDAKLLIQAATTFNELFCCPLLERKRRSWMHWISKLKPS
jgi:hypothetical protein